MAAVIAAILVRPLFLREVQRGHDRRIHLGAPAAHACRGRHRHHRGHAALSRRHRQRARRAPGDDLARAQRPGGEDHVRIGRQREGRRSPGAAQRRAGAGRSRDLQGPGPPGGGHPRPQPQARQPAIYRPADRGSERERPRRRPGGNHPLPGGDRREAGARALLRPARRAPDRGRPVPQRRHADRHLDRPRQSLCRLHLAGADARRSHGGPGGGDPGRCLQGPRIPGQADDDRAPARSRDALDQGAGEPGQSPASPAARHVRARPVSCFASSPMW